MDNQYFIYKDKRQQGPFTPEQLAGMGITSETFVWREGMGQWLPAWQVDELKGLLGSKQGGAPVPPPPPQVEEPDAGGGNVQETVPETPVRQPDRRRRRAITWLAVAAASGQETTLSRVPLTDAVVSSVKVLNQLGGLLRWEENGEEAMLENPIGTGAYKLTNWVSDDRVEFEAYSDYWGGEPYFKYVLF